MSIRRTHLAFEDRYTQIPNEWVRDRRLSRKARGLLVELMSHKVGWNITIESLVEGGPEGRDAVRTAIVELEQYGYLARARERGDDGRLAGIDYLIQDPWEGADNPTQVEPMLGDQPTKKNISTEDQDQDLLSDAPRPTRDLELDRAFDELWAMWPSTRRATRKTAWSALNSAIKAVGGVSHLDDILVPARRHAAVWHRWPESERKYAPLLPTWLNQERWTASDPEERSTRGRSGQPQRQVPKNEEWMYR